MGYFSFFTQDTNHRIINDEPYTVYLTDNKGNTYREDCYEGFGVFGGMDFFLLVAEMNGIVGVNKDDTRNKAILRAIENLSDSFNPELIYPSITEQPGLYMGGKAPEDDPHQGFSDY